MATITSTTAVQDVELATALAAYAATAGVTAEHTEGRTVYTATVVSSTNTTWTRQSPDHSRLQYVVSVTRTTSRSTKTFEVHVTREVGNFTSHTSADETALYASHVYNENGNAVYAAEFDGYRAAAVQAATALEAQYAAQDDQDQPETPETTVETAQAAVETPETTTTAVETAQTAVEDTVITTHLDPATGGRVLDDKDRQALRQGPPETAQAAQDDQDDTEPQDDTQGPLSAALDQAGPVEAASVRRTVFYLAAAYRNDPEYTRAEVLVDLRRRTGWSTLEAAQALDSELGETPERWEPAAQARIDAAIRGFKARQPGRVGWGGPVDRQ